MLKTAPLRVITVLALTVLSAFVTVFAGPRIPHKGELRSRVDLIYRAYQNKDRDTFESIIHSQAFRCVTSSRTDFFDSWNRAGHFEVASWKIRSIQAREDLREHPLEDCKGEPLRGDATALVFLAQTDRMKPVEGATTLFTQFWVHMDGTWYWVLPQAY